MRRDGSTFFAAGGTMTTDLDTAARAEVTYFLSHADFIRALDDGDFDAVVSFLVRNRKPLLKLLTEIEFAEAAR